MAMKPVLRQMRGPGMNKGLKKPRHAKFSDPETTSGKSYGASGGPVSGGRSYGKAARYDTGKTSYLSTTISGRDWGG